MTDAEIIPLGAGVRVLRGPAAEDERQARISFRRRAAYRRAVWGSYNEADLAMFGPAELLMKAGPGPLPFTAAGEPGAA